MEIGKSWETVQTGGRWRVWKEWEIKCSQRFYTVGTHHMSLSCSGLKAIAIFMRLFTDICSEVRYFSNRKSHPSGVRAPITNTAMVMSTGRLKTRRLSVQLLFISTYHQYYVSSDYRQYLCGRLTSKFLISKGDCWCALFGRRPLTSCRHQSPSTCWRAGWLWSHREGSSWRSWTAAGSSSALARTPIQSQSTPADQSAPGTDPQCSPEKQMQSAYKSVLKVHVN